MLKKTAAVLKSAFAAFYLNRLRIVASVVLLAIVMSIIHFAISKSEASVRISLNYSQASQGLNPNATRFSIYEFSCNEVLERTIDYAGIEGKITPEELKESINIHPADSSSIQDVTEYVSTAYNVTYKNPKIIPGISSLEILEMYCTAYKEYFIENYGDNSDILYDDNSEFYNDEPYLKLRSLSLKANQIQRYIKQRVNENTSYTDEKSGNNFLSVMKEITQVVDYDIPNIYAYIRETGISKDKAALVSMLDYKNKLSRIDYDTYLEYYHSDNHGIDIYSEAMSGIVLIPSVDVDKKFYMSRTETGLDEMAKTANAVLQKSNEVQAEITDTSHTINQMQNITASDSDIEKADTLLDELTARISDISDKLQKLDSSYVRYKTQNYLAFKYNISSFLKDIKVPLTVVEILLFVIGWYGVYVFRTVSPKTKEKEDGKLEKI